MKRLINAETAGFVLAGFAAAAAALVLVFPCCAVLLARGDALTPASLAVALSVAALLLGGFAIGVSIWTVVRVHRALRSVASTKRLIADLWPKKGGQARG